MGTALAQKHVCSPAWHLYPTLASEGSLETMPPGGRRALLGTRLLSLLASCTPAGDQWLAQPSPPRRFALHPLFIADTPRAPGP